MTRAGARQRGGQGDPQYTFWQLKIISQHLLVSPSQAHDEEPWLLTLLAVAAPRSSRLHPGLMPRFLRHRCSHQHIVSLGKSAKPTATPQKSALSWQTAPISLSSAALPDKGWDGAAQRKGEENTFSTGSPPIG